MDEDARRFSVSSKISPFTETEEVEDSLSRGSWWTSHPSFGITTLSCVAAATACQNGDHSSIKRHLSFNRKTTQSITNKGLHFDVFFSSPKVKIFFKNILKFFCGWISPKSARFSGFIPSETYGIFWSSSGVSFPFCQLFVIAYDKKKENYLLPCRWKSWKLNR